MKPVITSILAVTFLLMTHPVFADEGSATREHFELDGHKAFILVPKQAAQIDAGKPWVWYAPTFDRKLPGPEENWMIERLHAKGIALAGIDVGESYGSPKGRAAFQKLYAEMTEKRGYSKTPVLLARSRGGLMLYNWAVEHPDCVAGVAGIYPVCNLLSYPGLDRAAPAYEMTPEALEASLNKHNPVDRLEPLAKAKVPIFHIQGDSDRTVPLEKNTGLLAERYKALGGPIEVEVIEGGGHDMKRHWFESQALTDFMIAHALGGPRTKAEAAPRRPNVLFLFTDDQRFDTVHALGNAVIRTPNIDRLVHGGTAFMRAYIMGGTSPAVCSPSRAALFSGRTLWNLENQGMWGFEISDKVTTLPQAFREAGYETFATGKNEPGKAGHFLRSFSAGDKILFRGMTSDQTVLPLYDYPADGTFQGKKPVIHRGTYSAEVYADATINFLEKRGRSAKPFFAYVSFQTPHDPRQSPAEFRDRYNDADMPLPEAFMPEHPFDNGMLQIRDEKIAGFPRTPEAVKKHLADYYATIEHTDAQIGRIIDALDKAGELGNTIIVFTSDNGLAVGRHGLMGKQNVYDHSVHVPFIIAGPGIPVGERRDQLCYIYDVFPTLCERAGVPTPDGVAYRSLNKVLQDADAEHRDHLYFAFMAWQRAVQRDRFKLIEYCVDNKRHTQLFDLKADPDELTNLADDPDHADTLVELRGLLKRESERLNDGNTPYAFTDEMGKRFWAVYAGQDQP